jgi:hypothetical protein
MKDTTQDYWGFVLFCRAKILAANLLRGLPL